MTVDGRLGKAAKKAVWNFQYGDGLPQDGIAGRQTLRALEGSRPPAHRSSGSAWYSGVISFAENFLLSVRRHAGTYSCLIVGSGTPLLAMRQREEGFIAGLAEAGVRQPEDRVFHPEFTRDGSRKLIESLDEAVLADTELIFAVTDDLALGILAGLRARGLAVPGDVSVAGFDDIKTLTDIVPQLTTVHVPLDEVATDAIYRATAPKAELRRRTMPTHPIIRESTPPLGLQPAGDQVDAPEPLER